MRTTVLLGMALGFGAILLAWCARSPRGVAVGPRQGPARLPAAGGQDLGVLAGRSLGLPVAGFAVEDLRDSFAEPRSGHSHEALDIPAPRGSRVIATDAGTIVRLMTSARGGISIYQLDPTASYCYYYAHLDGYAPGLQQGQSVRRGDALGYVGSTGNAPRHAPHLHFAVSRIGPDQRCGGGTALNPYRIWARR